jgi:hypothetical protein
MGNQQRAPINEAVLLLGHYAPDQLIRMREELPDIRKDLHEGIWAGDDTENGGGPNAALLHQRASFMLARTIHEALAGADQAVEIV